MDALGDLLEPYSDLIAKFAGTVTCFQFLSGFVLLNDIRKIGSSDKYPPEPFLGGMVLTVLSLKLGALLDDTPMIQTNIIGLVINIVFMGGFYYYASGEKRSKIWSKFGVAAAFTIGCLGYSSIEDPAKVEFRFGMIIAGILLYLVGLPLLSLGEIIKKKSTEGLPFPLIFTGTIVSAAWALYGFSIRNSMVAYQNLVLFVLSAIQLGLFVIYPSGPEPPATTTSVTPMDSSTSLANNNRSTTSKASLASKKDE